jgi:hypothetical protein
LAILDHFPQLPKAWPLLAGRLVARGAGIGSATRAVVVVGRAIGVAVVVRSITITSERDTQFSQSTALERDQIGRVERVKTYLLE